MIIETIFIFIFGLIVGSFLNCVIWRIGKKQSFLKGRSYCPACKHTLYWNDLVPLLSFVFLKGKCRYCQKKISFQYPLVELAVGLIFLFIYNYFQVSLFTIGLGFNFYQALFYFAIASIFTLIFIYDLKHYLIPDEFTLSGLIVIVVWLLFNYFWGIFSANDLLWYFCSALGACAFFFCLWFFSQGRAMGFGDVKLAFILGLLLGWPNIIPGLFVSFLFGAIIGLILVAGKKRKLKSAVPFGPFLVIGCFLAIFYGSSLINWYLSLSFGR